MNRFLGIVLFSACGTVASAGDTAVSVSVGQPGFYGQITIGNFPSPQVIYAHPIMVQPPPVVVAAAPVYLHVPPGHEKHWSKHCAEYHACGQPVYFVRDDWYNNVYVPRYQQMSDSHHENHGHHNHGHDGDKDGHSSH